MNLAPPPFPSSNHTVARLIHLLAFAIAKRNKLCREREISDRRRGRGGGCKGKTFCWHSLNSPSSAFIVQREENYCLTWTISMFSGLSLCLITSNNKKNKCSDDPHSSVKIEQNCFSYTCLLDTHTPVTYRILCLIFLMYVRTIQRFNLGGQDSKKKKKKLQFMILTPVTLKQGQGCQTCYELASYNSAKFWKPLLEQCSWKKPMIKLLSKQETRQLSPLHMCASQN